MSSTTFLPRAASGIFGWKTSSRKCPDPRVIYDFFAEGGIGDLRLDDYFKEVPLGQGGVDFDGYMKALEDIGYTGFLTIEREVGENPAADIALAVEFLNRYR